MARSDEPLCGDPTCQGYACTQAAIDDYMAYQYEEARKIVRAFFPTEEDPCPPE